MSFKMRSTLAFIIAISLATWLLAACTVQPALPETMAPTDNGVAAENARQLLARQLHIDPSTIDIVADEVIEWPDACLGVSLPNELCAQTVIPGHKITFSVAGQEYLFHTDRDGYRSRVASAPPLAIGEMLLAWGGVADNGECMEAIISEEGVGFGLCGGRPQIGGKFAADARKSVLLEWVAQYAPFDAESDFGSIRFVGAGDAIATAEDQQTIGRWARNVAMEAAGGESLAGMSYQGPAEMGSPDTSKCAMLQLGAPTEAGVGACDGVMRNIDMGKQTYLEWEVLRNRFAPFVYETETEKVTFEGMGSVTGEQWQRAILAWARARHAELSTGKTSATISTALSWHLGQDYSQKNICRHLTVLDYGYATAEEILCEGLDVVNATSDWLTNEELATLDRWLYQRAPLYMDKNYIDGKGAQEMSEAEAAEANVWAMEVWNRIWGASDALLPTSTAASCPEAEEGLAMVRDYRRGFCLLVPADYTVFDTNPSEIAIVKESLLNVTEPRLYIAVSAAEGRSAEEFADEIAAEMAGFNLERSTAQVAGQSAVILDNVPGQDINRRVLIVHNDRLYDLTFTPMSNDEIEAFYATILDHFVLVDPES